MSGILNRKWHWRPAYMIFRSHVDRVSLDIQLHPWERLAEIHRITGRVLADRIGDVIQLTRTIIKQNLRLRHDRLQLLKCSTTQQLRTGEDHFDCCQRFLHTFQPKLQLGRHQIQNIHTALYQEPLPSARI